MIIISILSTTIEKAEVIDFYKTLLVNQSSNYTSLINFFMGITVLLIGSTWIWNIYFAKKQIKSEIEERVKKIKSEVEEQIKDVENKIDTKYNEILKVEVARIENAINTKLLMNEASLMISLALHCVSLKNYTGAINYYCFALFRHIELKNDFVIRQCVIAILGLLSPESVQLIKPEELDFNSIILAINNTPETLRIEKVKIIKEIDLLKAKIVS